MKAKALDELIANVIKEFESEGIILWKDASWPQFIKYKFILETDIVQGIIDELVQEFRNSAVYDVIGWKFYEGDRLSPLKLGFRRLPKRENRTWQQWARYYMFGGLAFGFRHYNDLNHFVTVYIVEPPTIEAAQVIDGQLVFPEQGKSVLIIGTPDANEYKRPTLDLMRTFYSAYQKSKILPKTPATSDVSFS